jgi:REP element-mobilizing transposase RayT
MLHAAAREGLVCPAYCLMPDHLHLVWMGLRLDTDQINGMAFLRTHLERALAPAKFQSQAHDHVLRAEQRRREAFAEACRYDLHNPVRAGLVHSPEQWAFSGAIVPGYPRLHPWEAAEVLEVTWTGATAKCREHCSSSIWLGECCLSEWRRRNLDGDSNVPTPNCRRRRQGVLPKSTPEFQSIFCRRRRQESLISHTFRIFETPHVVSYSSPLFPRVSPWSRFPNSSTRRRVAARR